MLLGTFNLAGCILSQCFYFINIRHCFLCFFVMINTCCLLIRRGMRGKGGCHFSGSAGVCLFLWLVGDSFIWGESQLGISLGRFRYQFLTQLANAGPKSVKVNSTNSHREVCRIKFYQIATSDVLTYQFDKMLFDNFGHAFIH